MSASKQTKRKLFFDINFPDKLSGALHPAVSEKIEKLIEKHIKTIFLISSGEVDRDSYLALVSAYQKAGFDIKSYHIDGPDKENISIVRGIIGEITNAFRFGNCLLLSFGRSMAGAVLACFYVSSGRDPEEAIEKVRSMHKDLAESRGETEFIYNFQRYMDFSPGTEDELYSHEDSEALFEGIKADLRGKTDYPPVKKGRIWRKKKEKKNAVITGSALSTEDYAGTSEEKEKPEKASEYRKAATESGKITEGKSKEQVKDAGPGKKSSPQPADKAVPAVKAAAAAKQIQPEIKKGTASYGGPDLSQEKSAFGSIFNSIRFKLISITSVVFIISLSGMILLASYFFKKDNVIREDEKNLKISEVISLKVKSDLLTIIEKSVYMSNSLVSGGNTDNILNNDRDFLFLGISAESGRSARKFKISAVNNSLLKEGQISMSALEAVHSSAYSIFEKSFAGDIIVHNISQGLGNPVIGMSFPYQKGSIIVCYVKLDKFLQIFQTSGITQVFMVNDRGDIIAHSDSMIVVSGANYMELPIVREMFKSKSNNGLKRYMDNGVFYLGSYQKIGLGGCGVIATVQESIALQAVYDQQRRNIYLMVIVLTIVILIVFFFGKTLTTPIISLLGATKEIASGNYNVRIRPTSKDEIGELTTSFIRMGKGLEEREKMKDAFGKFVSQEIAEQVLKGEIRLGGERKTAAVFFSDIRQFTSISEKLEPEEVVEFLNQYMTRMVKCINDTGGVVDKYIGDAIMAVWGAPISTGNDTENAVNSALAMRKSLAEFNRGRGGVKNPVIKIGCGINTGPVLAGQIGSEERMEYTVIGDTVNLASRIEALNKTLGTDILISQDAYNLVKGIYAVEKMSPINVKGKKEPQQIYAVLGRLDEAKKPGSIQELRDMLGTKEQMLLRRKDDKPETAEKG